MATSAPVQEILPSYDADQLPQSPFDALLTRISAPLTGKYPEARSVLESFVDSQKAPSYQGEDDPQRVDPPKPIDAYLVEFDPYYIKRLGGVIDKDTTLHRLKKAIIDELYEAIEREDNESIVLLIQHNMVTANVTSSKAQTPLLAAITAKSLPMVKQLLDLGADPNMFGYTSIHENVPKQRTPLMLAAHVGSLPIVKLLAEPPYSADAGLVAPDGQIALRLAVEQNHQMIVDYLPSLRAGGILRFKTRNALNIMRAKMALLNIYHFIKFFVWDIPKFFVWSIPKHVVVLPGVRLCKWSWRNRKRFANWCKHQAIEIPKKIWRGIKKIPNRIVQACTSILDGLKKLGSLFWDLVKSITNSVIDFIKTLPETVANVAKALWNFFTVSLPRWLKGVGTWIWEFLTQTLPVFLKRVGTWLWEFFTKRIPRAIHAVLQWIWEIVKSSAQAIWELFSSLLSFFHSIFVAIITFLRNVTLKDIWNAFSRILRSIFINIPQTLMSWLKNLSIALYNVLDALFGWFGTFLWELGAALLRGITYIPKKLWTILESFANSLGNALYEIRVWINPKI